MSIDYEISQLEKLGTWVVEALPKGQSTIPCSEVFKIKRGPDGEIKGGPVFSFPFSMCILFKKSSMAPAKGG